MRLCLGGLPIYTSIISYETIHTFYLLVQHQTQSGSVDLFLPVHVHCMHMPISLITRFKTMFLQLSISYVNVPV